MAKNLPSAAETPPNTQKYLAVTMTIGNWPRIDIKTVTAEQLQERINDYFQIHLDNNMKPTVSGLALALNLDRRRLYEIVNGKNTGSTGYKYDLPGSVVDTLKNAYRYMEILWENWMVNNDVNVVAGIFLGKNNYGYTDTQEHIITPNQVDTTALTDNEIAEQIGVIEPVKKQLPDKDRTDQE